MSDAPRDVLDGLDNQQDIFLPLIITNKDEALIAT